MLDKVSTIILNKFNNKKILFSCKIKAREQILLKSNPEGLTSTDLERFTGFCGKQQKKSPDHIKSNIINRTFKNRLQDHVTLMRDIIKGKSPLAKLMSIKERALFIDIGPGVGNKDNPAITSIEMAEAFQTRLDVIAMDLPSSFQILEQLLDENIDLKRELQKHTNLYFINNNALQLESSWIDGRNDAIFADRKIPCLKSNDTVIVIRAANSIDVYCSWDDIRTWIVHIAVKFQSYRVLLLLHREVLYKEQNSVIWTAIGQVSVRGFRHDTQDLKLKSRIPIYKIDKKKVKSAILRREIII